MFVPWLQVPYIYDIRTQPKVITTTTGTRDLQMVSLSLRLLYRPNEARLPVLHQTLGPEFAERVLPSIGNEVLKAVVARYDAESLLTQRDRVSQDIREQITHRAKNFDIELDDVAIVSEIPQRRRPYEALFAALFAFLNLLTSLSPGSCSSSSLERLVTVSFSWEAQLDLNLCRFACIHCSFSNL